MGDTQSAQREGRKDEAAEEESGTVDDAQAEQSTEDKPFKNNGQISEITEKAGSSIAEVNGHCEDKVAADAVVSPDEVVSETETALKQEETPSKHLESNETESPYEAEAPEDVPLEMTEMDEKRNDVNDGFRRFFSNIGLRLTIKRGSADLLRDLPDETNKEEPSGEEDMKDAAEEPKSETAEQKTDMNTAQETYDNDSTTCPTLTDVTSEEVLENAEEKATEAKEDVESDNADAATTSPVLEGSHQDAAPEEELHSTTPPEQEEVVSPIKRFFTSGLFSGLRKKRKPADDETTEKEMVDMGRKEVVELTEETEQDQQEDKELIDPGVEAAAVETEHKENEVKEMTSGASAETTDEGKSSTTDPSTIIVPSPQILNSQEKVQASPLKRLLSGSGFKKLTKKQRSRTSSDAKLSDSGEHASDQLMSSTEPAENQKEEGPAQSSPEAAGEEDGAWASFKKLLTPKKHRTSSFSKKESETPAVVEEPKPSEGEQISDHSIEEGKKRKDSAVSWEAVLCGSGKKRSRKTSDSEDETPQVDNDNRHDLGSKHGAELPLENTNEKEIEILVSSPKQVHSPLEGDGGSTWKSLKRLVTPKRKSKDEDESKDNIQSDSELSQDETSFSIKKLLPGRKKRKSAEKQDQVSSDEADKAPSGDEDSETPAVVPLSEFDTVESGVQIQTQVDIESHIPKEEDYQQDLVEETPEPVLPCDNLQIEAKKVEEQDDALENQAITTPAKKEEPDDDTELLSKHQQLSDITEEGVITETMATPASVNEEAGRDDTIAEDMIEITSEAITAPEPVSVTTLADETEMISAVSQLSSESSKTSGNTTPVPADYEVMETDALLHQVVESISTSPKAVPGSSTNPKSESIVSSVLHQIFKTFVKEDKETTTLEIHRRSDATAITTGQTIEELDAINELAATAQTESISEVDDSDPTELDTAKSHVDEADEVKPMHPEQSITDLGSRMNENESQSVPEEIVQHEGSLVKTPQAEMEIQKMDSHEEDSPASVERETKDKAMKNEVQTTENENQILHDISDRIQLKNKDQPVEVEELQQLAALNHATIDPGESNAQLIKEVVSEDMPAAETATKELREETEGRTEVHELETDAAKTDLGQVPDALKGVHASTFDSEEGRLQSPEQEVKLGDIPPAETTTDEPVKTAEYLTEVSVEPENKEPPVNAVKNNVEEPEVLEAVQSLEKEVISEDVSEVGTVTDELKEETVPLTAKTEHVQEPEELPTVQASALESKAGSLLSLKKVISDVFLAVKTFTDDTKQETEVKVEPEKEDELETDVAKTEHVQETDALTGLQASKFDSEEGSLQSPEQEVKSEDLPPAETITDEPKKTAEDLTEVSVESENKQPPVNEHVEEPEALEAVQAPIEDASVQSLDKEVISEDAPEVETATAEVKEVTVPLTADKLETVDASKCEHVQESEVLQTEQGPLLDSKAGSLLSHEEVISQGIPAEETVTDEPKQETEVTVEPEKEDELETDAAKTEYVQEPEELQTLQASLLESKVDGLIPSEKVISQDIPAVETDTDEHKQETEVKVEQEKEDELEMDVTKTDHVKESDALTGLQASTFDSEEGSVQSPEQEVKSEDLPPAETITNEPKKTAEYLTEVSVEPENKQPTVNEHVEEPEALEAVQAPVEDASVQSLEKEVISEDVPEAETVTDVLKDETIPLTADKLETVDASTSHHVQESEVLQTEQGSPSDSKVDSLLSHEDVISQDIPAEETVTDEHKQETEVMVEPEKEDELEGDAAKIDYVQEPEELQTLQASALESKAGSLLSLKNIISGVFQAVTTFTDDTKQETEVKVEPEREDELETDAAKTEHVQETDALTGLQASKFDSEEGSLQSPDQDVKSEDIPPVETITDEPRKTAEYLTEVSVESENKQPPVNEHVEEPEVLEVVQAPIEDASVQSLDKEVISEDAPEVETATDEVKEETVPLTADKLETVDASKCEHVQESEVLQTEQGSLLDSMAGSLLSHEEVISQGIPAEETVTDEPKQETEVKIEPENQDGLETDAVKTEYVQEPEILQTLKASALESKVDGLIPSEKVISQDIPAEETVTDEPKQETEVTVEPENQDGLETDAVKTEYVQEPEELQTLKASVLESKVDGLIPSEKVISQDIPAVETDTDEPKQETEVKVEPEKEDELEMDVTKTDHVEESDALTVLQASKFDSEEGSLQSSEQEVKSEDLPPAETITDEPKKTAENLTEVSVEPENKQPSVNEHVEEPEALEAVQAPIEDSEDASVQSLEKEVISEDVPDAETVTDELKDETIPSTSDKLETVDASKTDHVQEPEVLQTESPFGSKVDSLLSLEEVISQDIPAVVTDTDDTKQETEVRVEPEENLLVEAPKTECVQEPEVLPSDVEDTVQEILTEEGASTDVLLVTESIEEGCATVPLTETPLEPINAFKTEEKEDELERDAAKIEYVQEPEELQKVQASALESKVDGLLPLEKGISQDIPVIETVTDEPKQETEVRVEPEEKLPVEAFETACVQEQGSPSSTEEAASINVPVVPESIERTSETMPLTEGSLETVDASEAVYVQEQVHTAQTSLVDSMAGSLIPLEKVISKEIPAEETVTDVPKQETELKDESEEKLQHEDVKTEYVQEPEVLPPVLEDIVKETSTEESALTYVHAATESIEKSSATIPLPEVSLMAVVPSNAEHDQEPEVLPSDVEDNVKDTKTEEGASIHVHVEHDQEPKVLQTVQESPLDIKMCSLQPLGKVKSEDVSLIETVTDLRGEPEEKLPVKAVTTEYVQEPEVLPSDVEDTLRETKSEEGKPIDVLVVTKGIEGSSAQELKTQISLEDVHKQDADNATVSVMDKIESEVMAQLDQAVEISEGHKTESIPQDVPVEKEDCIPEVAEELQRLQQVHSSSVYEDTSHVQVEEKTIFSEETQALCVDSAAIKDESKRQVVADVDIKSTETIVDTVLEVEVTEAKEVINVSLETIQKVDNLSATQEMKEELINQHVEEKSLEVVSESAVVILERQPDAVTEVSELVESESNQVGYKKVSATGQQVSEDDMQTLHIPVNVSISSHREILEETPAEQAKSEGGLTVTEVVVQAGEAVEPVNQTNPKQLAESLELTDLTEVNIQTAVIIETRANIDSTRRALIMSPPVLLDIGIHAIETVEPVAKEPASPPPTTTERIDQVQKKDVSEFGVQAAEPGEPAKPIHPTQRAESPKQIELTEVNVQLTEITEPVAHLDLTERAVIMTQPELLDVGIHGIETVEPVAKEPASPPPTTTERFEPVKKTDVTEVVVQAGEEVEPVNQTNPTQLAESLELTDLTEVNIQTAVIIETGANVDSTSSALIKTPPILLDVGIHAIVTVEPVAKEPASPPPTTTERIDQVQKKDVSEFGVQAAEPGEPVKPIHPTQRAESPKQIELTEVNVQLTKITEPVAHLDLTERAAIMTQPELLDVGIHGIETVEPVAKEPASPPPTTTERFEPVKNTVVTEVVVQAGEAVEPVNQTNPKQLAKSLELTDLTEVNIQTAVIIETGANFDSTTSALIMTPPVLLDVGIHAIETVEPVAKEPASPPPPPTERIDQVQKKDVSEFGVQAAEPGEPVKPIHPTQRAESPKQIELTEVNVQPTEITEPVAHLDLTERAAIITQPELLDVGIHGIETVEPVAKEPASPPPKPKTIELLTLTDVSEVGGQAVEAVESVKPINPEQQRTESQTETELAVIYVQATQITEPEANLDSTESAVIITQPELLNVGVQRIETVEPEAKAQASPTPEAERIESLTLSVVSEVGDQSVGTVESEEPVNPTQRAESKTQMDLTEVNDLPPEITEPVAHLDSTEGAVIMTQPELLDVGVHRIETVEPGAKATTSPTSRTVRIECSTLTDASEVGGQEESAVESVKPIDQTQRAEFQMEIELTEVNVQPIEIKEPAAHLDLTQSAVIMAQPVLLDVGVHGIETVEPEAKEPASATPEAERIESLTLTVVSEVGGQAVEAVESAEPINPTQRAESKTQIDLTEVNDLPPEITEPTAPLDSTEVAVIMTQPELLDVGIHGIETVEPGAEAPASPTPKPETSEFLASVQATEITEPAANLNSTERAVIITQPELLNVGIQREETVEPEAKAPASPTQKTERIESLTLTDVSEVGGQEEAAVETAKSINHTQRDEIQMEIGLTEVNVQLKEITEPATHQAVIKAQPVLLDVAVHGIETVEPEAQAPASPTPEAERIESLTLTVVSEVGGHAVEAVESAEPINPTKRAESKTQIDLTEVNDLPPEITEPTAPLDSTEGAVIMTQPELLDIGIHGIETVEPGAEAPASPTPKPETSEFLASVQATEITEPAANLNSTERAVIITQPELLNVGIQRIETVEPEAKAPASPTQKTERIESLTLTDVSEVGGQEEAAVETAKSINQIGLTEVNVQPKEITEPATHQAVIKAQPVLLDVAVHGIETVEPVAKAPASQTPEAERIESLTLTDVSEVGGQAVESIKPINPTQRAESQTDLAVIYVQATEITEPGANLDSTKRALITTQPVLLDDGIQETEIVEPGEQIKSTVRVTSSVQATETIQPLSETEDREVLLAPPAQSEACEETKAEEHVNNTEEENDQDVWMDAEEVIYAQAETEVSFLEVEEPLEPQAESAQEEKAGLEVEVEIAPHSKTEEEESQEEVYKTGETGEIESEGEDFAIALEHQEYATLSIATMEWN